MHTSSRRTRTASSARPFCTLSAAILWFFAASTTEATELAIQLNDELSNTVVSPLIVAGAPPDSPANHVDPNNTGSPFGGVGSFFVPASGGGGYLGSGSAISSVHILTAAHLFDHDNNGTLDVAPGGVTFVLNYNSTPQYFTASAINIHPDYTGFNNPVVNDDLAIVTLGSPLPGGVPTYTLSSDPFTVVKTIEMVGYGVSGTGDAGYTVGPSFYVKRDGWNRADVYSPDDEGSGSREVFRWDFDGPTSASNLYGNSADPFWLTLGNGVEVATAPGDSGGPSFIYNGIGMEIFGVNTFSSASSSQTPGTFGTGGGGMVVSAYSDWINSVTGSSVPDAGPTWALTGLALIGLMLFRRSGVE